MAELEAKFRREMEAERASSNERLEELRAEHKAAVERREKELQDRAEQDQVLLKVTRWFDFLIMV